jgi:hypothetical protein
MCCTYTLERTVQYPMEKLCYAAMPDESSAVIAAMTATTSSNTGSSSPAIAPFELQHAAAVTGARFRDSGFKVILKLSIRSF